MKAIYQIQDDRFDIADLVQKKLVLEFQMDKFVFIVFNTITNSIEWLEEFGITNWQKDIFEVFEAHQFLKANFWQEVMVVFHAKHKAILPQKFIKSDNLTSVILGFQSEEKSPEIKVHSLTEDSALAYYVPAFYLGFLEKTYPGKNIRIVPLEACLLQERKSLAMFLSKNWINFSIRNEKGLEDTKMIEVKNRAHLSQCLDYFLKDGYSINLLGQITNYSSFYELIMRRKEKVNFGIIQNTIKLSQFFGDVPKHRYFTIFNSIHNF